ncbi:uncharacterized protein LOC111622754 isoform X2 [Centruroides sculpturatus]|uniref:uncharacterized protein LOC111622754 isoform X2 n=1 Tax=Centruroides sculpturatus TaxID=218467 RepID=UPI000C6D692D|nr:uncharacterized protein LOC111622754 isoform X2 [Centruroides sculpturatus]
MHHATPVQMWCLYSFMTFMHIVQGVTWFPRETSILLPADFPVGVPFYHLTLVDNGYRTEQKPSFKMGKVLKIYHNKRHEIKRKLFHINKNNGSISLLDSFSHKGGNMTFSIEILTNSEIKTVLKVNVIDISNNCEPNPNFCFLSSDATYLLLENTKLGTIIDNLLPLTTRYVCKYNVTYNVSSGSDIVHVDSQNGFLTLVSNLDAEENTELNFSISCQINEMEENIYYMKGLIKVKDINDNAPYKKNNFDRKHIFKASHVSPGKLFPFMFTVCDKDSSQSNNVSVKIENDSLNLFSVKKTFIHENVEDCATFIHVELQTARHFVFPGTQYNFSLIFEDIGYIGDGSNKVIDFIKINNFTKNQNLVPENVYYSTVSSEMVLHSRVIKPFDLDPEDGYTFQIIHLNSRKKIFATTTHTGIIYLMNERAFTSSPTSFYHLNLSWISVNDSGSTEIFVNVTKTAQNKSNLTCDNLCSSSTNETLCTSTCGIGSYTGLCMWRNFRRVDYPKNKTPPVSSHYATCSPDLKTCPDGICDELETLDKNLCPQDCAKEIVGGNINPLTNMGIIEAYDTCFCSSINTCQCTSDSYYENRLKPIDRLKNSQTVFDKKRKESSLIQTGSEHDGTVCGTGCVAGIFLCASVVFVSFMGFLAYHWVKRWRINRKKPKCVGSPMPSVVLSNYVDEHSSSVEFPNVNEAKVDLKWEFPRKNLKLEQTLGEGEFGKVMKARAWGINGTQEHTTVAVKMLKTNGTIIEQQDLLSEFNMLKEISHPNVIRLLGACTQKGGPLYIIVEYAEHGSLRSYLRNRRKLSFDRPISENIHTVWNPIYSFENENGSSALSQKDLLSFAWQIAKGMAYLSDMKLLHRDLAARNVLIAAGNIIKISDFGLSRDIYEGDTYLKRSKGRVPVKWMALESLEDHIYTTKSDVWSFGVVLWEIVTLGASPYPGITPERLFQLLKSGYRMGRPANCSPELHKIMLICWQQNPHERPSFRQLVQIFDTMLQETVEYLSLRPASPNEIINCDDESDLEENHNRENVQCDEMSGLLNKTNTQDENTYVYKENIYFNVI